MGFLNWKDWVGGALNVFKETPASDIGEGLIRHEWQGDKYNVQQTGTTLKAYIMNNLQMGLNFLIDSNHTVVNSEDHYLITIDGLKTTTSNPDGYELVENLHFSIKIIEENTNGISKLIINGDNYDFQKKENGVIVELNNLDLKAGKIYGVYYDGARFLIKDSLLPSTETEAGIISRLDIRSTEAANVLGAVYGGVFGSTLTTITAGKTYYYWDNTKQIYIPYLALKDATSSTGFLVPNSNFLEITNRNLIENNFIYSTPYNTGVVTISKKSGFVNLNYNSTTNYKFTQNDEVLSFISGSLSSLGIRPRMNYNGGAYILKEATGEFWLSTNSIICTKSMASASPLNLNYTYISDSF